MFVFAGVPFLVGSLLMFLIIRWAKEDQARKNSSYNNTKTALLESSSVEDDLEGPTIDSATHLEYISSI